MEEKELIKQNEPFSGRLGRLHGLGGVHIRDGTISPIQAAETSKYELFN